MVKSQVAFRILSSIVFETKREKERETKRETKQGRETKKTWFHDNFFRLQMFETFENSEIDFKYQLKPVFLNNDQYFHSYATFFVKTLTHYKTDLFYCPTLKGS